MLQFFVRGARRVKHEAVLNLQHDRAGTKDVLGRIRTFIAEEAAGEGVLGVIRARLQVESFLDPGIEGEGAMYISRTKKFQMWRER